MKQTIRQRFYAYLQASQRSFKDRQSTVGASEVFACIRKAYFTRFHGDYIDQSVRNLGILERGNVIENSFFVPAMRYAYGEENCKFMGSEQQTLVFGTLSATPDGLIVAQEDDILSGDGIASLGGKGCFAAECKSFDVRASIDSEKALHRGQAIVQLGMFRRFTDWSPDVGILVYENCGDFLDVRPFEVNYADHTFVAAQKRADQVYEAKENAKGAYSLPAEGIYTDQCKHCDFIALCRKTDLARFPSDSRNYTSNDVSAARSMALEYEQAKADEDDAATKKAEKSEMIKRFLNDIDSRGIQAEDFSISYSKVAGKEKLNKDALDVFLTKHGKTMEDFTETGTEFTRLAVKTKK